MIPTQDLTFSATFGSQSAALCSSNTDIMFAQQDHMQDLNFILGCLDFLKLDCSSSVTCNQACWLAQALILLSLSVSL